MLEVCNISSNTAKTRCMLISSAEESKNKSLKIPLWLSQKKNLDYFRFKMAMTTNCTSKGSDLALGNFLSRRII